MTQIDQRALVRGYSETRIDGDTIMETLYAVTPSGVVWRSDEHKFSHSFKGAWGWHTLDFKTEEWLKKRLGVRDNGTRMDFCGQYVPPHSGMI